MVRDASMPSEIVEIESFADTKDERVALNVACASFAKPAPEVARLLRTNLPQLESLLLLDQKKDRFELFGPGFLTHEACGFHYRVSHLSFYQVNRFLIEDLLNTVLAGCSGDFALDLYAGVGFFTLQLAKSFKRVISVDANLAATRDLRTNAEAAGLEVTSHHAHVEDFLKSFSETPDVVILDPPRTGLGVAAAAKLAALAAPQIAYLSCDPATLARDLAVFTQSSKMPQKFKPDGPRYEIAEVHFFDLFPQTYHIETLVRLRRAS
jgi:23S rRNA (uracil1939-C5)-methyltransferase